MDMKNVHGSSPRIALWQGWPATDVNKYARTDIIRQQCVSAKHGGVDILVFPEMFLTGYTIGVDRVRSEAEPFDGPSAQQLFKIAKSEKITIVYGYPEVDQGSAVYNSVNIIAHEHEQIYCYRKRMLFGEIDRVQFLPGGKPGKLININGVKYGVAICYDIEFPEIARELAVAGADVLLVPTANMHPYSSVADRLIPARAQENGIFVAYNNYTGNDSRFRYFGKSMICDPMGDTIASLGTEESVLIAELDLKKITAARALNNYLNDLQMYNSMVP